MFATHLSCDLSLLLLIKKKERVGWRRDGQTYRKMKRRSMRLEMQKERSSKETKRYEDDSEKIKAER